MMIPSLLIAFTSLLTTAPPPTADEIVGRMMEREARRPIPAHTSIRQYHLDNKRYHKTADMKVRVTVAANGIKSYEVLEELGSSSLRKLVFHKMLKAECESSRPDLREANRITPANYHFELSGTEPIEGRPAYILAVKPRGKNKFLILGRVWIDAEDYAIVKVEGNPVENPSFWTRGVHFSQTYKQHGDFWLPATNRLVTEARFFGPTDLAVEYGSYSLPADRTVNVTEIPVRRAWEH